MSAISATSVSTGDGNGNEDNHTTIISAEKSSAKCSGSQEAELNDCIVKFHENTEEDVQFIYSNDGCERRGTSTASDVSHVDPLSAKCLRNWSTLTNHRKLNTSVISTQATTVKTISTNREASQMLKKLMLNRPSPSSSSSPVPGPVLQTASNGHTSHTTAVPNGYHQDQPLPKECALSTVYVPPPSPYDFEVSLLGTGSAAPSKRRSNSSICIKLSLIPPTAVQSAEANTVNTHLVQSTATTRCVVILDAGEGVSRQLFQSVSGDIQRYDALLTGICIIWLSHHHGDHISGLLHLLEQIFQARSRNVRNASNSDSQQSDDNKILIFSPTTARSYLQYCVDVCGLDDMVEFVSMTQSVYAGCTTRVRDVTKGRVSRLTSISVPHCQESYAVCLEINMQLPSTLPQSTSNEYKHDRNIFKLVYSGDCRPSPSLSTAGRDCDLLIHEATFSDDCSDMAKQKRHCTTSEALYVAREMRAKHTILTHFSQRYAIRSQTEIISSTSTSTPVSVKSGVVGRDENGCDAISQSTLPLTYKRKNVGGFVDMSDASEVIVDTPYSLTAATASNTVAVPSLVASVESNALSFAVAFDLIRFRCPSQLNCLPAATRDIAGAYELMYADQSSSSSV